MIVTDQLTEGQTEEIQHSKAPGGRRDGQAFRGRADPEKQVPLTRDESDKSPLWFGHSEEPSPWRTTKIM